jgi:hypothetical protein
LLDFQKNLEDNLENYIQISEDALKLSLSHNLLILLDESVSDTEKVALKNLMNEILNGLSKNAENSFEVAYYNFISKFIDNDEVETKMVEKLLELQQQGVIGDMKELIAMNTDYFTNLDQESQFQILFKFLLNMGIQIEKTYKELDMLEAEAFNKPIFS